VFRRPVLGILLLSLLAYANALGNEFTYDDFPYVIANDAIHLPLGRLVWARYDVSGLWRPLTLLSYAANYAVGGSHPFSYHLFNILAHAAVSVLLYRLLLEMLGRPKLALAASLVFAVHPLHTEAVTSAAGRMEVLAAGFVFAAWLLHWREKPYAAAVCFLLALGSKESAAAFLLLVPAADWVLRKRFVTSANLVYGLTFAVYLALRWKAVGLFGLTDISPVDNPLAPLTAPLRIANALRLAGLMLFLHVYPARLTLEYSYNAIPVILDRTLLAQWVTLSAALLAAWIWLARRSTAVFLAGAIYLAGFALTSNILFPVGNNFGERWAYLPSAGFCLLAGLGYERLEQRRRVLALLLLGLAIAGLSARTIVRNADWRNTFTLFSAAVRAYPNSVKAQWPLGQEYLQRGDLARAEEHLQAAVRIFPLIPDLQVALGVLAFRKGDLAAADQHFRDAVRDSAGNLNANDVQVTYASFLVQTRRFAPALAVLDAVIAAQPGSSRAHSNRAVLYYYLEQPGRARADAQTALRLNPANQQAANLLEKRLAAGAP